MGSGFLPDSTQLIIEIGSSLFMKRAGAAVNVYKSTDKGASWSNLGSVAGTLITAMWHNPTGGTDGEGALLINQGPQIRRVNIADDTIEFVGFGIEGVAGALGDIFRIGATNYCSVNRESGGPAEAIVGHRSVNSTTWQVNLGVVGARTHTMSYNVIIGTDVYFIFSWSGEGAFLYKWDSVGHGYTLMATAASTMELPSSFNQRSLSYDGSDFIHFTLQDSGDSKYYLHTYQISAGTLTQGAEYNAVLMLDRLTDSTDDPPFNLEKGFHLTEDKVYQIPQNYSGFLTWISTFNFLAAISAITNHYVIDTSGNIYEYVSNLDKVWDCVIYHNDMDVPSAKLRIFDDVPIVDGLWVRIIDTYTSAGTSSTKVIFEGYVDDFTEEKIQDVVLISSALEMDDIWPQGQYSGRTDEIITSLLTDYTKYIKKGTFSAGIAMGTVRFQGDVTLREILNEYALLDGFIWYLTPTGDLYYNNGTIDSTINYDETDVYKIKLLRGRAIKNEIIVRGAFVNGIQIESAVQKDEASQQVIGRRPYEITIETVMTIAIADTGGANILTRLGTSPKTPRFNLRDTVAAFIQPGEQMTFQFLNFDDPVIASDQFGIRNLKYNARQGISEYEVTDVIL